MRLGRWILQLQMWTFDLGGVVDRETFATASEAAGYVPTKKVGLQIGKAI